MFVIISMTLSFLLFRLQHYLKCLTRLVKAASHMNNINKLWWVSALTNQLLNSLWYITIICSFSSSVFWILFFIFIALYIYIYIYILLLLFSPQVEKLIEELSLEVWKQKLKPFQWHNIYFSLLLFKRTCCYVLLSS